MTELRNLYFLASNGEKRLLAENVSYDEAWLVMSTFMKQHNFKSYYTRRWGVKDGMMFDVGSHTEFFLWGW